MDLDQAIGLIKKTVKNNGTNDQKHIDLGLVPAEQRPIYEKALAIVRVAIAQGKLTNDEFASKVQLNH